jgi:phage tail-like protein
MAGEVQNNVWPLPKFYFSVRLGDGLSANFQEVSGLESETNVLEYRHGDSARAYPVKMPLPRPGGNVTLRKGIFTDDVKFWNWYKGIGMNTIAPRTVDVILLDEDAKPRMTWTLNNAFPTKITSIDIGSGGNEVAVELLEMAYESRKDAVEKA